MIEGFRHLRGYLSTAAQMRLVDSVIAALEKAPLFQPTMPRSGRPFTVQMSNFGPLGWVSDKSGGYRYQDTHPVTGRPWPVLPSQLLETWEELAQWPGPPEACLINVYKGRSKLGSHVDRDEEEPDAPVISVSLGDDAVFHVGGLKRGDRKERITLKSGDAVVLGGPARYAYHGIDRIVPGTSNRVPGGGRINLTLRRVSPFTGKS